MYRSQPLSDVGELSPCMVVASSCLGWLHAADSTDDWYSKTRTPVFWFFFELMSSSRGLPLTTRLSTPTSGPAVAFTWHRAALASHAHPAIRDVRTPEAPRQVWSRPQPGTPVSAVSAVPVDGDGRVGRFPEAGRCRAGSSPARRWEGGPGLRGCPCGGMPSVQRNWPSSRDSTATGGGRRIWTSWMNARGVRISCVGSVSVRHGPFRRRPRWNRRLDGDQRG